MKQVLLATALIALPAAVFTGFHLYATPTPPSGTAGLGDLPSFTAIITNALFLGAILVILTYMTATREGTETNQPG